MRRCIRCSARPSFQGVLTEALRALRATANLVLPEFRRQTARLDGMPIPFSSSSLCPGQKLVR